MTLLQKRLATEHGEHVRLELPQRAAAAPPRSSGLLSSLQEGPARGTWPCLD